MMYWELLLTDEEYNTIMTAVRIELERNWGGDADVVKLLKDALTVLRSAEKPKADSSQRV